MTNKANETLARLLADAFFDLPEAEQKKRLREMYLTAIEQKEKEADAKRTPEIEITIISPPTFKECGCPVGTRCRCFGPDVRRMDCNCPWPCVDFPNCNGFAGGNTCSKRCI